MVGNGELLLEMIVCVKYTYSRYLVGQLKLATTSF